jgi:hypothetical protein
MKKKNSYCVFIISNGRANNVVTKKTLAKCGYTGSLYIVIDNEDKQIAEYQKLHGSENIVVFDKLKYASLVDNCDNFQNYRTTTHARNACFDIALQKGYDYFLVLDDDYTGFRYTVNRTWEYITKGYCKKLDILFPKFFELLETSDKIDAICILQGGDLIGGAGNIIKEIWPFKKRKAMNSFFCKTSRRFWFFSRLNEDVNTYMSKGTVGRLFMTIPMLRLDQKQTQKNAGGMSEAYMTSGTYVKSFYTVMICPSFAKVSYQPAMGRLHHQINWNNAVPVILDESHKKS